MTADLEYEWDSEDSHRHQNRHEAGSQALDYMLGHDEEDAILEVCKLDDTDLDALWKALHSLEGMCIDELGRRHS